MCIRDRLPFGAAVRALWVPDRTGEQVDVVLGYDDLVSYETLDACLGGTIGRCANRIGGACFRLSGKEFRLSANEGGNHLHGGLTGFHQKLWRYACSESGVTFFLESPDGEEGYPGTLRAVSYTHLMRYKNKFSADITAESGVESLYTIKLIIQPILENAIYHGMAYADGDGEIHIRAFRDGEDVIIEVADNGPGMPEAVSYTHLDVYKRQVLRIFCCGWQSAIR